jgi:hypothetical protein
VITAAPINDTRWQLADWLELEALCSSKLAASVYAINTDPIVEPDIESTTMDDEDIWREDRIARLTKEINTRRKSLGNAYPFSFTADGSKLTWANPDDIGGTVYLFCLLVSNSRNGFLTDTNVVSMTEVPDLFQACATWSAAGFEEGPAYALGIDPRSNTFLPKLATIFSAFGNGKPRTSIPPGAPQDVKDDGIDVISWKQVADCNSPSSYLLAQVASGKNWITKSVKAAIDTFLNTWFVPPPAGIAKPAMMMPFCIDAPSHDDESAEQEALAMHWRRLIGQYGEVFYRYRLPAFAARGLELHERGVHVDMVDWRPRIEEFVRMAIEKLKAYSR